MMRSNMTAQNEKTGLNDIGGATISVPQLDPIFSFKSKDGGDVYIYAFQTDVATFLVATFDDTASEEVWSITSSNSATDLLIQASRGWNKVQVGEEEAVNPINELLHDKEAMKRLKAIIAKVFYSGE